ncbi:LysR family transcriptional regulator [Pikeienuella piscinae]|uniref:LysR family transcriptional regulator n=1 Tax=Pikeienuella piscinae TaxID=2748098 RepID=A0A7L5BXS8_9RHOB|nr:LysR family transcriptional regulator [Pikeienuella piscinae]QIE55648.1 LysR family transcriptional regulator [Pikeienuella piscinae]
MSLSVSRLKALCAVAETGSFAAAARKLGVTQPNVSQQIKKLEQSCGISLFSRQNGQLIATPFCERASESAAQAIQHHEAFETMLKHHGNLAQGHLSIGLGNAVPGMELISKFNKAYPDVTLKVATGSFRKIIRAVLDQTVDVAILPDIPKDPRFRRKVLLNNRVVAIVPVHHRFASMQGLSCSDLLSERLIFRSEGSSTQKVVDRYFRSHNVQPAPLLKLDTREGVYEAVAHDMGVGFVWKTGTGRTEDVQQIDLVDGETSSAEVVFAPKDRQMEVIDAFFGCCVQIKGSARLPGPFPSAGLTPQLAAKGRL